MLTHLCEMLEQMYNISVILYFTLSIFFQGMFMHGCKCDSLPVGVTQQGESEMWILIVKTGGKD